LRSSGRLLYISAVRASDFDFDLPEALIAQTPAPQRDQSRLLVLHRSSRAIEHRSFPDVATLLRAGDVLILNDSRVVKARLRAGHSQTGRAFEILLLSENETNDWWAMMKPGRRAPVGTPLSLVTPGDQTAVLAAVTDINPEGHLRLRFSGTPDIRLLLDKIGEVPLPPYIDHPGTSAFDAERYQTVYARPAGSIAAPTAGLHFTQAVLNNLRATGIHVHFVTLHVGLGTFAPVKTEELDQHIMHEEYFEVGAETADAVNRAKSEGRRVIAVGTTSVRVIETLARQNSGRINSGAGRTRIFIYPPFSFQIVDALLTNFHLPRSTLLMLVSGFAAPGATTGRDLVLRAYREAIAKKYRFFSYGDAMLII
jgi:S-adenosylmethionine:tRNA ribosyltransferase-isomerase